MKKTLLLLLLMALPHVKINQGIVYVNQAPLCRVNDKDLKSYKAIGDSIIFLEYKNGKKYHLDYISCKRKEVK